MCEKDAKGNSELLFSFEHCIVPEVHKTEEDIKASVVYLNCQVMCSDSPKRMKKMAGSSSQDWGRPSED